MRTSNKTQKYSIAHNFLNFDHNIGMLRLKMIVLMRGIQLNKNFWNLSYPVLKTTQNDEKLHIFDSNSLCSKTQKYSIAHNFFNFDHNIGMLHLKMIVLMRGIQLNKNFWNLSYPVLTTTQNYEKLHIFDSNSLVILSIWTYHTWRDMYRWHQCNWTQIVENCNENKQQNSEKFDCSQLP